jgi:hypothetical protein
MSETITASDGNSLPLSSLAQAFTYDGDFLATITVVYANQYGFATTYVQTFTNDGSHITNTSQFIAQT